MQGLKRILTMTLVMMAMTSLGALQAGAAKPEIYLKERSVLSNGWNYALNGYDPVSYFTESGPQPGSDLHMYMWRGALWRFVDRDNMNKFVERPESFAPQYGGYCAWAVAQDRTAPGDPTVWAIHGGKLYLNISRSIKRKWDKDRDGLIEKADANWPAVLED